MTRIDTHQHFWTFSDAEFGWIDASMASLRRDFGPADLEPLCDAAGIDRVVAVQARQSLEETRWLLDLADHHPRIGAVVGWVPLIDPHVESTLAALAERPRLTGVRHVLHDEPDDDFCLRDDFNRGLKLLPRYRLAYDLLIFPQHLPQAARLVDRHPRVVFVADHLAKPRVRGGAFDHAWAEAIRDLARREHVYCKVSGLTTEVRDQAWDLDTIRPYVETVLEAFGPGRLMFGSDWPVCLLRTDYVSWARAVATLTASLSDDEQAALWGGNARKVYRVS